LNNAVGSAVAVIATIVGLERKRRTYIKVGPAPVSAWRAAEGPSTTFCCFFATVAASEKNNEQQNDDGTA